MKGWKLSHVLVLVFVSCFCEGCLEEERTLLLQFRDSISHPNNGSSNIRFQGWEGKSCCRWYGVICNNSTSHVVELSLNYAREEKQGIWYPNTTLLAQFKQLQVLELQGNQIGGSITLQGLCELKYLSKLDLSRNLIEGDVPQCLGTMHSLLHLDLSNNRLQGTLSPLTFSNLTMIRYVSVSNNQLAGLFPLSMLANLSNLDSLDLSSNHLEVETESPTWIPRFQLIYLKLASCKLNARSDRNIPSFIFSQHTLGTLDLSNNLLIGDIPSWLLYNSISVLLLDSNMLSGPFPLPYKNTTSSLHSLYISNNKVSGPLPTNFSDLFPRLLFCDMSSNYLQGSLPNTSALSISIVDLSNNDFTGKIPQSFLKSSTFILSILRLSNNNLEGEMFPRDYEMSSLYCLELDGNRFTIPPNLSCSPTLVTLDIRNNNLSGNVSSWLEILPGMAVLFIGGNHFDGPIPLQICQMTNLRLLDLSASGLEGTIPSCIANVPSWRSSPSDVGLSVLPTNFISKGKRRTYSGLPLRWMTLIDMSWNKLTGTIPFEMGNMGGVRSLNLSNNILQGTIPTSFQGLELLESLDLSHNKLSGAIPQEMTKLSFLSIFTVAFNNLSGEVPYQDHFLTFSESSYEGNPGLCGKPLERNCSSNIPSQPREREKEEDSSGILDSDLFFYSCNALSYFVGLWGMIAFLYFNESCRRKFFSTADAFQNWCFVKFHKIVSNFRNH